MPDDTKATAPAALNVADAPPTPLPAPKRTLSVPTKATHPLVLEKDKSIHSEHGVIHYPFYYGGLASCVAVCCTQPLGVVGLRLQTQDGKASPLGMTRLLRDVWSGEGIPGLWRGLSPALVRTALSSGIRFGVYEKLKEMSSTPTHTPTATTMVALATGSGVAGSICSNFAEIITLRMQNDPGLPVAQRYNYNNIGHGLIKMTAAEGWRSMWTGVEIAATRAGVSAASQLAGYDIFKRELLKRTTLSDNVPVHVAASCLSGFLSTFLCIPLDVFKARVMTRSGSRRSIRGEVRQLFAHEGPTWMFRGLVPALISRGPSTIITFVTFEQLKQAYRRAKGLDE